LLKKEIRILGLAAAPEQKRRMYIVGAIFRGNMWVDAAFVCTIGDGHRTFAPALARSIMQTKQYSQLHAVIMSGEYFSRHHAEIVVLADKIKLPLIALVERGTSKPSRNGRSTMKAALKLKPYTLRVNNKAVRVRAARISEEAAHEIFKVSCPHGSLDPEAVRVAKVLADHISLRQRSRTQRIT
jgi:endonuclease V-like protein UPF0215 family